MVLEFLKSARYELTLIRLAVQSFRVASTDGPSIANSFYDGALKTTMTPFVETFAIRVDENMFGYNTTDGFGLDLTFSQPVSTTSVLGIYGL